jgi:tRNA (cytidine/uridine-2'-O-)-methyltransferase
MMVGFQKAEPHSVCSHKMAMRPEEAQLYPSQTESVAFLQEVSPLAIVLVEPQIPQNTGNIMRLAACTGTPLYLVGNLGFRLDEKALKRSAMDYEALATPCHLSTFDEVLNRFPENTPYYFLSAKATHSIWETSFPERALLVFGSETRGLPPEFVKRQGARAIRIPMVPGVRSHNLSNAVAITLYEALRQRS